MDRIEDLRATSAALGDRVRALKAELKAAGGKDAGLKAQVAAAVVELKAAKAAVAAAEENSPVAAARKAATERREAFERLMLGKMFVVPAFEIYGGVAGLYDFGPPGSAVMSNIRETWRRHFVIEEDMLEVSATALTPEHVLRASGHVDRFTDLMVRDETNGECYRADHLLEEHVDAELAKPGCAADRRAELLAIRAQADAYSPEELGAQLRALGVVSPDGNALSEPYPYNLMLKTMIGPTGKLTGFMRPETAQGIFVNFRRLLEFNSGKLPFAAAQIGLAFRNEIAPRAGLLRVREFQLAEIEHFCSPADLEHARFAEVAGVRMNFLPRAMQGGEAELGVERAIGEAVADGTVDNKTLAYFMARTQLFLVSIGIDPARLRFRQHLATEMAHYSTDCWDAEIQCTHGWVECVGHAYRGCFDLQKHTEHSKTDLRARVTYDEPRLETRARPTFDKRAMGKAFKKDAKTVSDDIEALPEGRLRELGAALAAGKPQTFSAGGKEFELQPGMVTVADVEEKVTGESFYPHVIEPSFGLGRIFYCVLDHAFDNTAFPDDPARVVLRLPPSVAPYKVAILPVERDDDVLGAVARLRRECSALGISSRVDTSKGSSIGKKYARTEELGVPFAVSIDRAALARNLLTLRSRDDGGEQVHITADEAADVIAALAAGRQTWADVRKSHDLVSRS